MSVMLANLYAIIDAKIVGPRRDASTGRSVSAASLKLVLLALARHEGEPMSAARIAGVTGLSPLTAKRAARVLDDLDLVHVRPHADDGSHTFVAHRYYIRIETLYRLAPHTERAAS